MVGEHMKEQIKKPAQTEFNFNELTFTNPELQLTKIEKKAYNLIPVGKENAVSAEYLAQMLNVSTRAINGLGRRLRLKHCDVGSVRDLGYYRFKDLQEYSEYMAKATRELYRREQVLDAMRFTPMAQQLMVDSNEVEKNE